MKEDAYRIDPHHGFFTISISIRPRVCCPGLAWLRCCDVVLLKYNKRANPALKHDASAARIEIHRMFTLTTSLPYFYTKTSTSMESTRDVEGVSSSFPTNPQEFDSDERISFQKLDNKFLLVQEDGTEYEFDDAIKRWIPTVDEALLERQQEAYKVSGVDESEPVEAMKRKRKKEYVNGEDVSF